MKDLLLIHAQSSEQIHYDQGGEIVVYDTTHPDENITRTITVSNNTRLIWYGLSQWTGSYSAHFSTDSWECHIRFLLLSAQWEKLSVNITSALRQSNTITDIHILSLVGYDGIIELNGTVQIDTGVAKVKGHILEENIFLGSKGNIRGIPSLLVHSDDVEAGHAARIERVSDEKLYYLRSRGIPKDDATVMMIESAVRNMFSWLDDVSQSQIIEQLTKVF